jgi:hypothetical protein
MKFKTAIFCQALIVLLLGATTTVQSAEVGKIVQSIGHALQAGHPTQAGDPVQEGSTLTTGADGYLYIKTLDNGFFILRPNTTASIPAYHIDPAEPNNSRFKIELQSGVLRSISGQAVKQARQNFRFNTPLAAIGVRGTDFTVFTTDQATRVAVMSGGVVVGGFGEGCSAAGAGPCDNAFVQELFAEQTGQILQVLRGSATPQRLRDATLTPDSAAPPRKDEPVAASNASPADVNLSPLKASTLPLMGTAPELPAPAPMHPSFTWGRWQALADQGADFNLPQAMASAQLVALNSYFALLRTPMASWQQPKEAGATFTLQASQAQVLNPTSGLGVLAALENASLALDFRNSHFATRFDLVAPGMRLARRAEGYVAPDGSFGNTSQFLGNNNMLVQGALSNASGLQAGYLFQSRLDDGQSASGVTYWVK